MRLRTWLVGAAALALVGASGLDVAYAQHHGGGGGGGGGGGARGGGGAPSFGGRGGGTVGAAPSFRGAAPNFRGTTTGAAPNMRANTFNGGNRFNAPANNFRGNTFRGNTFRGTASNNWGWRGGRDHRRFRGGFFAFGYPYYGDDYAYDYSYCDSGNYWDWRWRQYCGPYAYGGDYYGGW